MTKHEKGGAGGFACQAISSPPVTLQEIKDELEAKGELRLKVKVVPKASRSEIAGVMADGTLKARVQAPPEKGKANAALCDLLASALGTSPREVVILGGETSPMKHVRVRQAKSPAPPNSGKIR